ncbi:hypothetical protein [Candidatus Nitrosarchaeum limnium]|jgi:hypothetical protein|uniref:Uncharacterized protein n=1 Tax=Candidatus Nitrosarchaeum limnium BG20 TaxID=859192 RepID=S2DZP4_9ARCH|nr:hypothetical protein [Candidatus Nitrosarchaeum limnium]EPA04570.1 hypothetical protein BG20_I0344 [Candidatus Nitrosarchaeum limnium BG20]
MTDPLIDDVKELLDKEKGDERILKQIYRACENNEVISNYERNYVKSLAEKHLGRIPQIQDNQIEEKHQSNEKPIVPDVIFSKTSSQKVESLYSKSNKNKKSTSKNTKILLGAGGATFVMLIIISMSLTGILNLESNDSQIISEDSSSASLSIKTDLATYQKGDIISISGTSDTSGKVTLSIKNQDGKLIWSEAISVKNNGRFSTLAIAGGPGWDKSGTYTIQVNNNSETKSNTFSFKA